MDRDPGHRPGPDVFRVPLRRRCAGDEGRHDRSIGRCAGPARFAPRVFRFPPGARLSVRRDGNENRRIAVRGGRGSRPFRIRAQPHQGELPSPARARPVVTSTVSAPPAQKKQLLELTSTRFFAAMAVLLGHFNEWLDLPSWLSRWIAGGFGVSFFFVLSGFILTYVYWEHFEGGVARRGYRRYLVARFARIYPSYAMGLVLITLLYVLANVVRPGAFCFPPNPVTARLVELFALQSVAPPFATPQQRD